MSEPRCRDCRWAKRANVLQRLIGFDWNDRYMECRRPRTESGSPENRDPVEEVRAGFREARHFCSVERKRWDLDVCGAEGRYWEPRP